MTSPSKADFAQQLQLADAKIADAQKRVEQGGTTATTLVQVRTEHWWSTTQAMTISTVVLGFGLIVFLLATYLLKLGKDVESVLRIFGTIMIVFLAVFLVVAGYSDTQIAPVMGLLGTIAGYLLGRDVDPARPPPGSPSPVPTSATPER